MWEPPGLGSRCSEKGQDVPLAETSRPPLQTSRNSNLVMDPTLQSSPRRECKAHRLTEAPDSGQGPVALPEL